MAINISNISFINYLWTKKNSDGTLTGIRLSKNNLPTDTVYTSDIPAVNNGTLTIQKNGTEIAKFTANSSTNQTANITVPTKVSELTNDSGFLTSHQSLANYVTLNTNQTITGIKTFNAPTNTGGAEQATMKLKTANGGAVIFGKEGPNSGSMIRLDQTDGTCRLRFRSSATAGAMVWEQPESGSALYYDVNNVLFRNVSAIQFNNFKSAGYLYTDSSGYLKKGTMPTALKNPNALTFGKKTYDGSSAQTITANDLGALTSHQDISGKVNKSGDTMTGNLTPATNKGASLGTPSLYWSNIYGTTIYENGTSLANKYASKTNIPEAYLTWGGKNFSGSYGPIDAAMVPELGANRFAFMPANAVAIEYSRDGGATWTDYGAADYQKIGLFNGIGSGFTIGKASSGAGNIATNKYQLRVNIYTSVGSVYTVLNKFVIYLSTSGTNNNWCTIRARKQSDYTANKDT